MVEGRVSGNLVFDAQIVALCREAWHRQGNLVRKQNVFDDFKAAPWGVNV